jgi:hypothetical protein
MNIKKMDKEIRYKHLNEEWTEICKQIQTLQRRRVQIYKEAEGIKPGNIVLKIERSPSIYYDLNNQDIDQFIKERT